MTGRPSSHLVQILEAFPDQIQKINEAIKNDDHQKIVEHTSTAINMQRQLLFSLLEVHSYALSMVGDFQKAQVHARQMIQCMPTSLFGYARLGHILSLRGNQLDAIDAYNHGLVVARVEGRQTFTKPIGMDDLEQGKDAATKLSKKKIDFLRTLPVDAITSNIIAFIPQNDRLTCIQVSKCWFKLVLDRADVWRHLMLGGEAKKDIILKRVASYLGDHVEDLVIGSSTIKEVRSTFIEVLQRGYYDRIQSLTVSEPDEDKNMQDYVPQFSIALHEIRKTLTHLTIHVGHGNNTVSIATILSTCINLTDLVYFTHQNFSTHLGNVDTQVEHRYLENLEIKSSNTSGQDIELILQCCQQLRRLVLHKMLDISVLDELAQTTTPNLELLGYNDDLNCIPQLQKKTEIRREIGLKYLRIDCHDVFKTFQLLYKNRATLEHVCINIPNTQIKSLNVLYERFPDFYFTKLKSLSFDAVPPLDNVIIQSMRKATTLQYLKIRKLFCTEDMLIEILLKTPPVQQLCIEPYEGADLDNHMKKKFSIALLLSKLFEQYAKFSTNHFSALQTISISSYGLYDSTLNALSQVKTLRNITLSDLYKVSPNGITEFFYNIGHQLTAVQLKRMDCVTDEVLTILAYHGRNLSIVGLEYLAKVTDKGVKTLLDISSPSLVEVNIINCARTTDNCISGALAKKRKVYYTNSYFSSDEYGIIDDIPRMISVESDF